MTKNPFPGLCVSESNKAKLRIIKIYHNTYLDTSSNHRHNYFYFSSFTSKYSIPR